MDVFEKVRELGPLDGTSGVELSAARRRLLAEIAAESGPAAQRRSRRRISWAVGGLLGTAVTATVIAMVMTSLAVPDPVEEAKPTRAPGESIHPTPVPTPIAPDLTASEVLRGAAASAAHFDSPALAPGQYLRHDWTHEELILRDPSADSVGWAYPGSGMDRAMATGGWVIASSGAYFTPSDLGAEWYAESGPSSVAATLGDAAGDPSVPTDLNPGRPLTSLGGAPSLPEGDGTTVVQYLDVMPREPQELLDWAIGRLSDNDGAGWTEGRAGWFLTSLLSYNVGDPTVRSAMYEALSLLPGTTVGPEVEGARTVVFDSNLAAPGQVGLSLTRYTLTIEMSTGLVEEASAASQVGEGVIPASVPDSRITYATSVVDGLP